MSSKTENLCCPYEISLYGNVDNLLLIDTFSIDRRISLIIVYSVYLEPFFGLVADYFTNRYPQTNLLLFKINVTSYFTLITWHRLLTCKE